MQDKLAGLSVSWQDTDTAAPKMAKKERRRRSPPKVPQLQRRRFVASILPLHLITSRCQLPLSFLASSSILSSRLLLFFSSFSFHARSIESDTSRSAESDARLTTVNLRSLPIFPFCQQIPQPSHSFDFQSCLLLPPATLLHVAIISMWSHWALLPLLAAPSLAQQILQFGPGQLPQCAQSCQLLTNAQTACISVPTTEHSCFCQSAYLTQQTNLYQTDSGVCTDTCPQDSDRQQIQNWFKGYCADPNSPTPPPSDNNGAGAPPASSTAASAPAATTSSFAGTPVGENDGSWYVRRLSPLACTLL